MSTVQQSYSQFLEAGSITGPKASTVAQLGKLVQLEMYRDNNRVGLFTFLIPPESYQQVEAGREQIVQTLGGGYADLFGPALVQIQFSGTTGLQVRIVGGLVTDGYERFQQFLGTVRGMWQDPLRPGFRHDDWHFYLWNWTDSQYFEVLPLQNSWSQAVPRQLVFYYNLSLVGLRRLDAPLSTIPDYAIRGLFTHNSSPYIQTLVQGTP